MTKIRIKSDWNHGAVMYVLKTRYDQYVKNKAVQPICLYCSSDVGGLYPYAICAFAIKRGLRIVFMPTDGRDPWIAYGGMTEEDV